MAILASSQVVILSVVKDEKRIFRGPLKLLDEGGTSIERLKV